MSELKIQKVSRALQALLGLQTQGQGPETIDTNLRGVIEMKGLLGSLEARIATNAAMAAVGDQAILTVPPGEVWQVRTLGGRLTASGLTTMSALIGLILPGTASAVTVPLATSVLRTAAAGGEQVSFQTALFDDLFCFPGQQISMQLNAASTVGTVSGLCLAMIVPFSL